MLEIMKDSRIGSYGAIAMVLSFALRATALASLIETLPAKAAAAAFIAALVLSRGLMVWHWQTLPAAKTSGLAAGAATRDRRAQHRAGNRCAALPPLYAARPASRLDRAGARSSMPGNDVFGRLCDSRIGGHTGDTIGACQQITEIVTLVALALAA